MRRKIVFFFLSVLFFILSVGIQSASADNNCTTMDVSPASPPVGTKQINISITSTVGGGHFLGSGAKYDVYIGGTAIPPVAFGDSSNPSRGLAKPFVMFANQPADENGSITIASAAIPADRGALQGGTFNVYVFLPGAKMNPGNALCTSKDFSVSSVGTGDRCVPSITSSANPNNVNHCFSTADTITIKATQFLDHANPGDTHKLFVEDPNGTEVNLGRDACIPVSEFEKGIQLPTTLSGGTYKVRIENGCGGDKGCDSSFTIGAEGGSCTAIEGQSQQCWVCPANSSNFNDTSTPPTCINSSNKSENATSAGFCSGDSPVCDHAIGCVGADGLPVNNTPPPTNPPFCDVSGPTENPIYTCHTAIGDVIASPQGFVAKLFGLILSISGGIALLLIIISGYKILSSQGNPEALKGAREQLIAAIVGLLFIIFALVILQIIGFDILHIPGFGSTPSGGGGGGGGYLPK